MQLPFAFSEQDKWCASQVLFGPTAASATLTGELIMIASPQMADPNVLKQYIFQKGFVTEATKQRRQLEAANSTLQVSSAVEVVAHIPAYKLNRMLLSWHECCACPRCFSFLQVTGAVGWRREGIRYKKNEVSSCPRVPRICCPRTHQNPWAIVATLTQSMSCSVHRCCRESLHETITASTTQSQ